jgi:hypothetical protein
MIVAVDTIFSVFSIVLLTMSVFNVLDAKKKRTLGETTHLPSTETINPE